LIKKNSDSDVCVEAENPEVSMEKMSELGGDILSVKNEKAASEYSDEVEEGRNADDLPRNKLWRVCQRRRIINQRHARIIYSAKRPC